jgi:type II secretory pathway component PulC
MRQPFWVINSFLLMLAFLTAGFIYFGRPSIPERVDIEPAPYRSSTRMESAKFNISKIYEDDLFDTYQKELIPTESSDQVINAPEAPSPIPIRVPEEPRPQFIEPLPIALKGIIVVLTDDNKNRAIIMDNRTNKEGSYKVGDMIEDAQLIKIFSNKVILMRANGQQEVLYLREKDAKLDPTYASANNWEGIITQTGPNNYTINTQEFISRIQSLGQFIDTLELTTAYKEGQSVGVRVTNAGPGSLGQALGFTKEDLITMINDTPVGPNQNRLTIYKEIAASKTNDTIRVTLTRRNQEITLNYVLHEMHQARKQEIGQKKNNPGELAEAEKKQMEQKHSFAPSLQEIRDREKMNMLQKGRRPTQNVLSNE